MGEVVWGGFAGVCDEFGGVADGKFRGKFVGQRGERTLVGWNSRVKKVSQEGKPRV